MKESKGLSPVEIRKRSEEYARKFIDIQRRQFRRLGVLGTWEHPYLTLAPGYEAEIVRSFAKFVENGLVYQSKKPVLWSTGAQTALAEAEVEYQDKTSPAIFVKFAVTSGPFADKASIVIWTTTPWTLPANLAIAVHPEHNYVRATVEGQGDVIVAQALLENFVKVAGASSSQVHEAFAGADLEGTKAKHPFLDREATVYTAISSLSIRVRARCISPRAMVRTRYLLGRQKGLTLLSPVDDNGCLRGCRRAGTRRQVRLQGQ